MASNVRFSDAIDAYIAERAPECAEKTTTASRQLLLKMLADIGNVWVKSITPDHVARFFNGEFDGKGKCVTPGRRQNLEPASFNFELGKANVFFNWARESNMISRNPCWRIRKAIVPRKQRARLDVVDLSRALDCCAHPRDRAFIALAMNTGLRSGELTALKVGMLDLGRKRLDVTIFKSTKTDTMPVTASLDREMRRWLRYYEDQARDLQLGSLTTRRKPLVHEPNCDCGRGADLLCPDWFLAPAKNPHRFGPDGTADVATGRLRPNSRIGNAQLIANDVLRRMGVKGDWGDAQGRGEGMHTFRRAAAQAVLEAAARSGAGRDSALEITRSFLHHSSVATTERYLDREKAKDARDDLLTGVDLFAEPVIEVDGLAPVVPLRPLEVG